MKRQWKGNERQWQGNERWYQGSGRATKGTVYLGEKRRGFNSEGDGNTGTVGDEAFLSSAPGSLERARTT